MDEIWISEMIVSEQIVLDDEMDLAQLQKGQHFALISEYCLRVLDYNIKMTRSLFNFPEPHQRYKPQLISVEWEFEILK